MIREATGQAWRRGARIASFLLALTTLAQPAPAQAPSRGDPVLAPPSLPSLLPGGGAIPGLPAAGGNEMLQRLLDAAGGRSALPPGVSPAALPAIPLPPPAPTAPAMPAQRAETGEPLSGTEAFFAVLPENQVHPR